MEPYIENNVSARHKALASPPIILAEHKLFVRIKSAMLRGGCPYFISTSTPAGKFSFLSASTVLEVGS